AAVLLLEGVLVFVPERHDPANVHLVVGGQHGRGVLRILEAPGDGGAKTRHLHPLLARRVLGRDRGPGGRGRGGRGRRDRGGRCGGGRLRHVFLHDPSVAAGARDLGGGEAGLGHRLPGRGGIFHVGARRRRFRPPAGGAGGGRGCRPGVGRPPARARAAC